MQNVNAAPALSNVEFTALIREGRLTGALITLLGVYETTDGIKDDEYYYCDVPALEATVTSVFDRILEVPDYSSALKEYFGKEPVARHQEWLSDDVLGRDELHKAFIRLYQPETTDAPNTPEDYVIRALFGDPRLRQLHAVTEQMLATWAQDFFYPVLLLEDAGVGRSQCPESNDLLFGAIELLSLYSRDFEEWLHQKLLD